MTVEVADFEADVIEASRERPVLVDFWAPWCGPCRELGPILERLAAEPEAGFTLAKLNTDENQDVAMRYRISSIPAVKLFVDGEVVDEFIGAMPEPRVRNWLSEAIPTESKRSAERAQVLIDAGDLESAEALLQEAVDADPTNARASILLARLLVLRDPDAAMALSQPSSDLDTTFVQLRESVQAIARLLTLDASLLPESPAKQPYVEAIEALKRGETETALAAFIQALRLDRRYDDDGGRRAALSLFRLLTNDPAIRKQRPAFDAALF